MPPRLPTFRLGLHALPFLSIPTTTTTTTAPTTLLRLFSSTPIAAAKSSRRRLAHVMRNTPPYPYPIKFTFKQAWFGLYGGRHIQFGNKIADESEKKSRRTWLPNVKTRRLWSNALGEFVKLDVVVGVLRTIDKVGGLDAYLTGPKPARVKELGPTGWKLRWRILNTKGYEKQLEEEKKRYDIVWDKPVHVPKASRPEKPAAAAAAAEGVDVVPEDEVLGREMKGSEARI